MWGLRPLLSQDGITLSLLETSEVLGNISGGVQRGFVYDGVTTLGLQLDTQQAFGWYGGTFNVSALQIHGSNLSQNNLLSLQTASGIEADRSTRLWELWYDQKFRSKDRIDLKIGQQSLDQEFMVSQNALLFVNTMFGWPMLPSADMPGGGPAYPLSALGARVRAHPTNALTVLAGLYNGSPVGNNAYDAGDPQRQNSTGTSFPLHGGALAIAELQYAFPALGGMVEPGAAEPLAGTYKLGFWYDSERFADQAYDSTGLSLADPASNGMPQTHRGNYAIYAVMDQTVWQDQHDADRSLAMFLRPMWTPLADRNLITFSVNAGLVLHDPLPQRPNDTLGIGVNYARVSGRTATLDRDTALFAGSYTPVQSGETVVEATYQYQATPCWQIQPDIQYTFNPGGGVANPNQPGQSVKNELVVGVRTNIAF
jgi:porin